ncbi:alpha/beta hydrolase [Kluyvera sichuanensis]
MAKKNITTYISFRWRALLFPIGVAIALSGCVSSALEKSNNIAKSGRMDFIKISTSLVTLASYQRIHNPVQSLHIYIEGDGKAWLSRTQPSTDPTPNEPTALRLAALDPAANVVYLARPCQFIPMAENPQCHSSYWTGKRFSPEVIQAMSEAITQIKQRTHIEHIVLVGYSGGGALAALLAERRDDIISLRTVAGYLDVEYANTLHHVSPMPDSLNPIDYTSGLAALAQIHFSGGNDTAIPPVVAQRFVARVGERCARQITVAGMTHRGPWETRWSQLLTIPPACTGQPLAHSLNNDE